ncbi:MarR family winged helix-turn-helix transcriptional regulator [Streptomyces neyagawaensis]|jgi:DNA-binding MarR family transcriptional regulator|uniref:MarR family winged helix-turn-helix transcriptional regulator n=1 Tax=Streptomyces neyagawaensis TaxID=42238 RepID=A0ABV3B687_9ACTN
MQPSQSQLPIPGDPVEADAQAAEAARSFAPDADIDAMLMIFGLVRAAERLQQDFEVSVQRPAGLTWAGFRALFAVKTVGELTPLQLARLTNVSQASVSAVLNTLERKGLIQRSRSDKDGRSVTIQLTDYGHDVVGELFARNNAREAEWARALTARERGTLIRLLQKIRRHEVSTITDATRVVNGDVGTP